MDNPHQTLFVESIHRLEDSQRDVLNSIVASLLPTAYGRHYSQTAIASAEQYVKAIPLVRYENIRPYVERIVKGEAEVLTADRTLAFFKTSGSTSKPKLVPVTPALMRQKVAAFAIFWGLIYRDYPDIASGTLVSNFIDAGESERIGSGLEVCSESSFWAKRGRSMNTMQRWPLPAELRLVKDTKSRLYAVARLLMQSPLHCIMCLNPSTLLQFCRVIVEHAPELERGLRQGTWGTKNSKALAALDVTGKVALSSWLKEDCQAADRLSGAMGKKGSPSLQEIWPTLKLIVCWQSSIVQPYFSQLSDFIRDVPVRDYISQSSECMMAIPVMDGCSGGALAYTSHFYEFIAESDVEQEQPETRFAWQLKKAKRYELVVTTGGGLYRYRTGDCIEVKGFMGEVPLIEFLYRFGKTSSITGEKLTEQQVMEAAREATLASDYQPREFLCYPSTGSVPHYSVMIDGERLLALADDANQMAADERWLRSFDKALRERNSEYSDKCDSGRLGPMVLFRVDENALSMARVQQKAASVSDEQIKSEVLTSRLDCHQGIESATYVDCSERCRI